MATKKQILKAFDDDAVYYADNKFITNSSLKLLKESPTKFYLKSKGMWDQPSNDAFDVGHALHSLFLENKTIHTSWDGTRRGAEYQKFCKDNPDTIVLTQKNGSIVDGMFDKLQKSKDVEELMGISFKPEVPMIMDYKSDAGNIIPMKGKADAIVFDGVGEYIVDLKTTRDSISKWARDARWNYAQQAYIYTTLFGIRDFKFLVIQKEFPYDVGIFYVTEDFLDFGEHQFKESIRMYEKLFIDGEFKPYSAIIGEL